MTRLANQEKAGYFPLPPIIGEIIASYLHAPQGGRLYDPCAGCGQALGRLAGQLQVEPYGVELDTQRAKAAQQLLTERWGDQATTAPYPASKRIIAGDFNQVQITPGAFNVVYANPPYLFSDEVDPTQKTFGRDEYKWLKETRKYVQPGGVYIWVIPQHMLLHSPAVRYLVAWYDRLHIGRFPDPEYGRFRQVVVMGQRRTRRRMAGSEEMEQLYASGRLGAQLPVLAKASQPHYTLPALTVPPTQMVFRHRVVDPQEAIAEAARQGIITGAAFRLHLQPRPEQQQRLRPLTPMKQGHLVSIIAAGLLNGTVLDDGRERLMIKGQAYKTRVRTERTEQQGDRYTTTTIYTEKVVTRIVTLSQAGQIRTLSGQALHHFLSQWLERLTQKVVADYPPVYTFDAQLNGYAAIIRHLNPHRLIPRVGKPGLLPAQAHAAAAAAMRLEQADDAYIIGEMGTGKTVMGIAIAAIRYAKSGGKQGGHVIVMCPPHLVRKWQREVGHVWPAAKTTLLKTISDVDRFFAAEGPIIGIMKETSSRQATGWHHAYDACGPVTAAQRSGKQAIQMIRRPLLQHSAIQLQEERGITLSAAKLEQYQQQRGIRCPTCGERPERNGVEIIPLDFSRRQLFCHHCQAALYQMTRRVPKGEAPGGSFQTYVRRERSQPEMAADNNGYARWPLATYIHKRYKGHLDLLICDEMHQFKGADSDRGYAYHRLCCAADKVLGLTGTIYGGKASTLFHLLYRASARIRRHFTNPTGRGKSRMQWQKWVTQYGILQEIEVMHHNQDGQSSGDSKSQVRIKELPGGSPAMLPWLLEACVFVNLPDMGFALPNYQEIPVVVEMSEAQRAHYNAFTRTLKEALAQRLQVKDKSLLGAYVQATLTLPDSPWRDKGVFTKDGTCVAYARALPDDRCYPKEAQIIDLIQARVAAGEKVLLLCQQTSTLDITPRWRQLLEAEELRVAILKVEPDKREVWIARQLKAGLDVLISHPKRVETGLDLMAFSTIIWMGTEYSSYTIQQASRRSWRIGQTKDVRVYYFVYAETMQERALGLIAAKLGAATRINGDTVPDEGLSAFDEQAGSDLVGTLSALLQEDVDKEAAMKQVNEAYALAQVGRLDAYVGTPYSFADCETAAAVKQRYRHLAKQFHPDSRAEEAEKQTVETLNDLFQQANRSFHESEQQMGEVANRFSQSIGHAPEVDEAWDRVIQRLILGKEVVDVVKDTPADTTETAEQEKYIWLGGLHILESERPNYRYVFGIGWQHVDEIEANPQSNGTNGHVVATSTAIDAAATDVATEPVSSVIVMPKHFVRALSQAYVRGKQIQGEPVRYDGHLYVTPTRLGYRATADDVPAYRLEPSQNHPALVNHPPTDPDPAWGAAHGQIVMYAGQYHILLGPPLHFRAEAHVNRRKTPVQQPSARLIFGVHDAGGQLQPAYRLDQKAAQQMSLFAS